MRGEIKRDIDTAAAGQEIKIPVNADIDRLVTKIESAKQALDRLNEARSNPKIDVDIASAQAQLARVQVRLDELRNETSTPKIDADIAVAEAKMAALEERIRSLGDRKSSPKVDVDIAAAQAKLDQLRSQLADAIKAQVEIDLDAAGLREEVALKAKEAAAGQEVKVKVKVDEDGFNLSGLTGSFRTGLGQLRLPIDLIIPGIAAIGSLSGALGLIPAAAGLAGTGLAAMLVGVTGITETIKAYTQAQDAAMGRTATSAAQQAATANSLISASQAVVSARRGVADAERNYEQAVTAAKDAVVNAVNAERQAEVSADQAVESATRSLQSAEDSLTNAKHAALLAERNLTDARLAATRALEDAPNKVRDAELAQQAAIVSLQQAQSAVQVAHQQQQATLHLTAQGLVSVPAPIMPAPNTQALNLAVEQAQQRVVEMGVAYDRAKQDADMLTAAGVDGSKQVISAQDQVAASQKSVANAAAAVGEAQEKLVQAHLDGDQKIIDAKHRVTSAQLALTDTEIRSGEQIIRSKEAVDNAVRAQQQAMLAAGAAAESAAGSMSAFNARLAQLAPNARDAVLAFLGLSAVWHALAGDVQQHLFAGVGDEIRRVGAADLPVLHDGLVGMAAELNHGILLFGDWLASAQTVGDSKIIFGNFTAAAHEFHGAIQPILDIFRDLAVVGSEFLPGFGKTFAELARHAADFIRSARDSGKLKEWMQTGIDTVKTLWGIFRDLVGIIKDVANGPGGDWGLLAGLGLIIGDVRWLLDNFPLLIPILESVFLVSRVMAIVEALKLVKIATLAWTVAQWLLNIALDANPIGLIVIAVLALAGLAYLVWRNWDTIIGWLTDAWHIFSAVFWIVIRWIEDRWNDFLGFLGDVGRIIFGFGGWMWNGIVYGAKWMANQVIGYINGMIRTINVLIHGINWTSFGAFNIPDIPQLTYFATGGIGSGLALVGERGPELVHLPTGSQVMPTANTRHALSGPNDGAPVNLKITIDSSGSQADQILADWVRRFARVNGGGNVQVAFGS
jgi:hypothetical protein